MSTEALYWIQEIEKIRCTLCPHYCLIGEGKAGICHVRRNEGSTLIAGSWGKISGLHNDPIEKKPLYHFFPGRSILSIGSIGCNMHCRCCQNWQISQVSDVTLGYEKQLMPADIAKMAVADNRNLGVAYTYNEPGIGIEFMLETARLVQNKELKNVMVSNGFINESPLNDLLIYIDAFNIDLKGFTEEFYRDFAGAALAQVLRTLKQIRSAGRHLEITFLVIPGQNDQSDVFSEMVEWIAQELGDNTVLHLSRYHPAYKLYIEPTDASSLEQLLTIARKRLFYVYAGNIHIKDFQDTRCSNCGHVIIKRSAYTINKIALTDKGFCVHCGNQVIIVKKVRWYM